MRRNTKSATARRHTRRINKSILPPSLRGINPLGQETIEVPISLPTLVWVAAEALAHHEKKPIGMLLSEFLRDSDSFNEDIGPYLNGDPPEN